MLWCLGKASSSEESTTLLPTRAKHSRSPVSVNGKGKRLFPEPTACCRQPESAVGIRPGEEGVAEFEGARTCSISSSSSRRRPPSVAHIRRTWRGHSKNDEEPKGRRSAQRLQPAEPARASGNRLPRTLEPIDSTTELVHEGGPVAIVRFGDLDGACPLEDALEPTMARMAVLTSGDMVGEGEAQFL